jgi:single-stranded-DNA-specific exonuclease
LKYKLIKPINKKYSALEQVLTNRGIDYKDIKHYINTTDDDINSPLKLGEGKLQEAAIAFMNVIGHNENAIVVVDSDCDGFTSSALLINYLYDLFPTWVNEHLTWIIHEGKQHGLSDCCDMIIKKGYSLAIIPDAGSNDYEYHKKLKNAHIPVVVLDHHEADYEAKDAIIINNQLSDYPNKQLSGVGISWQFCRFLDSLLKINKADQYIDLVALGNTADMMSLLSIETKHLINKGFEPDNIHNPFIYSIWQKNQFKLGDHITSWGAAFYIAPFVNAIVRSGTQEEKEIVFKSMLSFHAFDKVPSTKRGRQLGEEETIVEQAMRICTNVKNRQTRAQDAGMEFLENKIKENNMLDHQVLLFLVEPGQIDKNIAGLVANKIMAKYQRPCCVLTKVEEIDPTIVLTSYPPKPYIKTSYQGSARGCDMVGVTEFKDICANTGLTLFTAGHQGAFGLGISAENVDSFISATDETLKDMPSESLYYVDYIYDGNNVNPQNILDIAEMDGFWGKDIETALVAIENLTVTPDMVTIYRKSSNTIKITLPNKVSLMLFNATEEDCDKLQTNNTGFIKIDCVGTAHRNEWMGNVTPQIFIDEYEIVDSNKYFF